MLTSYSDLSYQRDKAFALHPWPCIGQLRFLRFSLSSYPAYPWIVKRLQSDRHAKLLDLGCCFGQDLRKAVADGVRSEQLVGLDKFAELNQLGYELFRDRDKLSLQFHERDIMDDAADWGSLESQFSFVHMTSFLHIWNWEGQLKAAKRVAKLTRPGSIIVGSGLGSREGGEFPYLDGDGTNFRQSEETFQQLWEEAGQATGSIWDVKATFKVLEAAQMNKDQHWAEPNMGVLTFEIVRVS